MFINKYSCWRRRARGRERGRENVVKYITFDLLVTLRIERVPIFFFKFVIERHEFRLKKSYHNFCSFIKLILILCFSLFSRSIHRIWIHAKIATFYMCAWNLSFFYTHTIKSHVFKCNLTFIEINHILMELKCMNGQWIKQMKKKSNNSQLANICDV